MRRAALGLAIVILAVVLIVSSIAAAYQRCPPNPTYNGTAPPPAVNACQAFAWSALPVALLVLGILVAWVGATIAISGAPRPKTPEEPA